MDLSPRFFGKDVHLNVQMADVGTTIQMLSEFVGSGAINQALNTFFGTTGLQLDVTSSSANDVMTSGSGAWKVKIYGLDANWAPLVEEVQLNGQTAVVTVGKFRRVFGASVSKTGSGGIQAGDIYIVKHGSTTWTAGVPGTIDATSVVCKIVLALGCGFTGYWTVPADKSGAVPRKGRLMSLTPSGALQNAVLLIQAQPNLDASDTELATVYRTVISGLTAGVAGSIPLEPLHDDYAQGTDIILKVIPLVAAGNLAVDLHIRYV